MIAVSIACTVAETLPPPCDEPYICHKNPCDRKGFNVSSKNPEEEDEESCSELNKYLNARTSLFFALESACVGVFTFEYLVRLATAPARWQYVKEFMSVVDLFSILPYYASIFLRKSMESLSALVLLRILRVFRVLKFTRHSSRLRSLLFAIKRSASELGFIVFSFSLGVTLFSSVLYYAEREAIPPDTNFTSIPASMWYSVVTMTTTG